MGGGARAVRIGGSGVVIGRKGGGAWSLWCACGEGCAKLNLRWVCASSSLPRFLGMPYQEGGGLRNGRFTLRYIGIPPLEVRTGLRPC